MDTLQTNFSSLEISDPLNVQIGLDRAIGKTELDKYVEELRSDYSRSENLELFRAVLIHQRLSEDELKAISQAVPGYINAKLRACFPGDAFVYTRALSWIAQFLPNRGDVDLKQEWREILSSLGVREDKQVIKTIDAYEHFRYLKAEEFSDYPQLVERLTQHLGETLRRAKENSDVDMLAHSTSVLRILAYLHKRIEGVHFACSAEYDQMIGWGVDPFRDALVNRNFNAEGVEPPERKMDYTHPDLMKIYESVGVKFDRNQERITFEEFLKRRKAY